MNTNLNPPNQTSPCKSSMTLTDLCNYYRECIKQDDLNVCLDGDNFVLVGTGNGIQSEIFRTSEISAFLQRYKASFIHVGYPCYIDDDGKRVPVFIFDISFEVDKIFVDLSSASINRIGLDNCGLLYDDVDYDELLILEEENLDFNNLHDAFGDILSCDDWFDFRYATTLRDCILNECVLFVESINYTKGLASELKRLSNFTRTDYEGSALEKLLHVDAVSNNSGETCPSLCHVTPLNFEQEEAIRDCFNRKIQVITGPPGTGKSQVITNFVINAVIEGKSVLVVSKNNKAVDVVEQRINSLTEQTSFLRLGSNKYATRLTEFISSILTSRVKSGIKKEINEAKQELCIINDMIQGMKRRIQDFVDLRNKVDLLEQTVFLYRDKCHTLFNDNMLECLPDLQIACKRYEDFVNLIDVDWSQFWNKVLWFLCKNKFTQENNRYLDKFIRLCKTVKVDFDTDKASYRRENIDYYKKIAARLRERMDLMVKIKEYKHAMKNLSELDSLESMYVEERALKRKKTELSNRLWRLVVRRKTTIPRRYERALISDVKSSIVESLMSKKPKPFSDSEMALIRKYIPCWGITSLSVKNRIPFLKSFFDFVVFDEASQCDIASALPLLYRAKNAVIVGDPMQLTHVSRMKKEENDKLRKEFRVNANRARFSYISNSLYDCAIHIEATSLRNHYRSHPHIINFSNDFFYSNRLRVATNPKYLIEYQSKELGIIWHHVKGYVEKLDAGSVINRGEAKRVVQELEKIICKNGFCGSIGVVTPFRPQANLIRRLISRNTNLRTNSLANDLIIDTVHKFQGDEKDIMLFSPVVSEGIDPKTTAQFLNGQVNLFNVAITRARSQLIVVGNFNYNKQNNTVPFLNKLATYCERIKKDPRRIYDIIPNGDLASNLETAFYRAMIDNGIDMVHPQYSTLGYSLDFAIIINEESKLNIEIDGERYHRPWNDEDINIDRIRNEILESNGWTVMRFWSYEVLDDIQNCIEQVKKWIVDHSVDVSE